MPAVKTLQRSFNGGILSPEMYGQLTDAKYANGLVTCRNFICKPQGPAVNRPGTKFVREVKDSTKHTRLISFTYSTTQTMAIEMGAGYFRFHTQGATLLYSTPAAYNGATAYSVGDLVSSAGVNYYCIAATSGNAPPNATYWYALPTNPNIYEIPSPYVEADLFDIHYVQSADVMTLTHPNYAPRELRRLGATNWQLSAVAFAAPTAPGAPTLTPHCTTPKYPNTYAITAIGSDGVTESSAGPTATTTGNLLENGGYNDISWAAVTGATRYNVYKLQGGLLGYIGQTTGTAIIDDNIAPDMSKTPPLYDAVFSSTNNYPAAVSYFEQRRCFAGTNTEPQTFFATKSGTESNMGYSLPSRDDDRLKFRVAAREANTIRHIVPLSQLLLLTGAAEWRVTSVNSDAITPSTISVKPQSYVGASNVQPVIVNNTLIYAASRGGHVRECAYSFQSNGFITGDLSLRAPHLFDNLSIVDMAYSKAPDPLVWMVSSNGTLLGLTYVPEQQVGAWHEHDTDGVFESCAVVAEGNEDVLYVIVRRVVNGVSKRYVERLQTRQFATQTDAFFVDCGLTYVGDAVATISGLGHIEGKTVNILINGAVHPQRTVTSGAITLDIPLVDDNGDPYEITAHIGLQITADAQTLPLAMQVDAAFGQGRFKNVNKVWLRVYNSSGIFAGPTFDDLTEAKQRTTEPYGSPPALKSGEIEIDVTPSWADTGQVCIRQSDPLPLMLVSLIAEVVLGG